MSTIRHMLEQQDFLEVETPVLESTAGQPVNSSAFSPNPVPVGHEEVLPLSQAQF